MLSKLFDALARSRTGIADAFKSISNKTVTSQSMEDLEEQLLSTDMGYDTVDGILDVVRTHPRSEFMEKVREHLISLLPDQTILKPFHDATVLMVVGVNGTGKTTSAAKIAHIYKELGHSVTLVAADTYRAAAVEQLKIWSNRVGCRLVCNEETAEPTAVLFDGLDSAKANGSDVVVVDTAGRLHTRSNLMAELDKMYRVIENRFPEFNVCSLITLDASLGQNSLNQVKEFHNHGALDGVILTKLDGTARGGIVFPLFKQLGIPVKFLGVGEDLTDLELFDPESYVDGLLGVGEDLE